LFSHFNDFGEDWIYSPGIDNFITDTADPNNVCGITDVSGVQGCGGISFTNVYRKPSQQIVSVQAGARHLFGGTVLNYEVALSQARYTGGFGFARYFGPGGIAFGVDTKNPFTPKFPVLNGVNLYDPTTYSFGFGDNENDGISERDVVGDISLSKPYKLGGHFSTFEVGFKGWDARKTSLLDRKNFDSSFVGLPMTQFLSSYRDNNYYFGQYQFGPTTSFAKLLSTVSALPLQSNLGFNLPNDFDISERIWAGYAMDTIDLGRFRLQAGFRIESTADDLHGNDVTYDSNGDFQSASPLVTTHSYINVFPSVQAQYRFTSDTVLRAAYGAGIARPNFQDQSPFQSYDQSNPNVPVTAGNPNLLPTHAQNFDLLLEHYLKSVGLIQGGFFYKYLTNPIYSVNTPVPSGPLAGFIENIPINGPNAHITGFEAAWQQRLTFMPGALNGLGVSANYSYTTSQATFPADNSNGRTDHPSLVRTAPNNWNFDVTYDKKGISARMGLSHNDAYIWSYGSSNLKDPSGDTYLYPHTQVDAQVSYWIPRSHGMQAVVSMLNLNNEVFGFYFGAEQYPIQREYYNRTVSVGLRWTPFADATH
jgi:TonB-dependent receptor